MMVDRDWVRVVAVLVAVLDGCASYPKSFTGKYKDTVGCYAVHHMVRLTTHLPDYEA